MAEKYLLDLQQFAPTNTMGQSIWFIGTATTLIEYGGFTLLTDPNFLHAGQHAQLGYGITSERLTNPAVEIAALPPVDLCILSHYHGDHWDEVAAAQLRRDLPVVTTGHAAGALNGEGFQSTYALDTWESLMARNDQHWLRVTAMPGRHGPAVVNLALPPVMGSLLEWGSGQSAPDLRMYISGDTMVYEDIKQIPQRFPEIDVALLHLGGTKVMGLLVTMDAKEGIEMVHILQPRHIVPIHYNDYTVFESPIEDFLDAARRDGLADRVHFLKHGERLSLAGLVSR